MRRFSEFSTDQVKLGGVHDGDTFSETSTGEETPPPLPPAPAETATNPTSFPTLVPSVAEVLSREKGYQFRERLKEHQNFLSSISASSQVDRLLQLLVPQRPV